MNRALLWLMLHGRSVCYQFHFRPFDQTLTRVILLLLLFPFLDKDEVRYSVPGIVNADKEQQQCSSADEEQSRARM